MTGFRVKQEKQEAVTKDLKNLKIKDSPKRRSSVSPSDMEKKTKKKFDERSYTTRAESSDDSFKTVQTNLTTRTKTYKEMGAKPKIRPIKISPYYVSSADMHQIDPFNDPPPETDVRTGNKYWPPVKGKRGSIIYKPPKGWKPSKGMDTTITDISDVKTLATETTFDARVRPLYSRGGSGSQPDPNQAALQVILDALIKRGQNTTAAATAPPRQHIIKTDVKDFDIKKEEAVEWLSKFKATANNNQWDDATKASQAKNKMKGPAEHWYNITFAYLRQAQQSINEVIAKFKDFEKKFEEQYKPKDYQLLLMAQLHQMRKSSRETYVDFCYRLLGVALEADENMSEETKVYHIKKALVDDPICDKLFTVKNLALLQEVCEDQDEINRIRLEKAKAMSKVKTSTPTSNLTKNFERNGSQSPPKK